MNLNKSRARGREDESPGGDFHFREVDEDAIDMVRVSLLSCEEKELDMTDDVPDDLHDHQSLNHGDTIIDMKECT